MREAGEKTQLGISLIAYNRVRQADEPQVSPGWDQQIELVNSLQIMTARPLDV
jgi:hypothetical protein